MNTIPGKHSPCFADSNQSPKPAVVPGLEADTARHYRGMDLRLQRQLDDSQIRRGIRKTGAYSGGVVNQDLLGQIVGLVFPFSRPGTVSQRHPA